MTAIVIARRQSNGQMTGRMETWTRASSHRLYAILYLICSLQHKSVILIGSLCIRCFMLHNTTSPSPLLKMSNLNAHHAKYYAKYPQWITADVHCDAGYSCLGLIKLLLYIRKLVVLEMIVVFWMTFGQMCFIIFIWHWDFYLYVAITFIAIVMQPLEGNRMRNECVCVAWNSNGQKTSGMELRQTTNRLVV